MVVSLQFGVEINRNYKTIKRHAKSSCLRTTPSCSRAFRAKDLVDKLLMVDPKKRLTAKEALKHPWMQLESVEATASLSGAQENMRAFSRKLTSLSRPLDVSSHLDMASSQR